MSPSEQAYQGGVSARSATATSQGASTYDPDPRRSAAGTAKPAQRPAGGPASTGQPGAPRRVRLTVSRVDPWSVMKLSFLLSVAIGIAMVVAAGVLWTIVDGMGVFSDINGVASEVMGDSGAFNVNDYIGFGKVLSLATVIAVVDVVLLTAIATLGAFLYNIASSLVGGLHVTLSDD